MDDPAAPSPAGSASRDPGSRDPAGPVLIETRRLEKAYAVPGRSEEKIHVLRGIDLTIHKGEMISIVGQSGVGKSTLLQILGTLDHPTAGQVLYDGVDVFALPPAKLAAFRNAKIGFVFQFHHLLPEFDAVENVMMPGLIRGVGFVEMRERATAILREVGLGERLGHRVGKLSGGERQRVAVARALVLDPPLLLADEPTGNLDPRTGERITDLLLHVSRTRGTALVVVTHSPALAERLGRIVTLIDGRVVS